MDGITLFGTVFLKHNRKNLPKKNGVNEVCHTTIFFKRKSKF